MSNPAQPLYDLKKDESTTEIDYHNHDFYEIYCFISGKVTYVTEGKSYKLNSGDIILIDDKDLHKPIVEKGETYERIVIWVNPDFLVHKSSENSDLTMCFESSSSNNNLLQTGNETKQLIWDTIRKFENACNSISFGSSILKELYLIELIVHLNKAFVQSHGEYISLENMEYNENVDEIIKYINKNLIKNLSLDHLCDRFFISKYHLIRLFKKYTGYTVHKYVNQKRLMYAKALLKAGTSVTETYLKCGFGDYANFIRSFKKAFNISPKKYSKL